MSTTLQREIPRAALRFDAGPVRFAAAEGDNVAEHPIDLQIRSPDPIVHWYWGRIIHDMAGFTIRKDTLPLDYCHNYDTIVGMAWEFTADAKTGLSAKGKLISIAPDDRANEIIKKGKAGVPYENSLDWSGPARIEWVDEGMSAPVNGQQFDGPGYVVREWNCQGVAVCPHGADGSTRTQFSDASGGGVSVTLFSNSGSAIPMSTSNSGSVAPPAVPAAAPPAGAQQQTQAPTGAAAAAAAAATPVDPRAQFTAELKRFTDRFGMENGSKWFSEGLAFGDALEKFIEFQGQQLTAANTENASLQQKLASVPRGEEKPAQFSTVEGGGAPKDGAKKFSPLSENHRKFAEGLKLPK